MLAWLPELNASLNGLSALLLLGGFLAIRRQRVLLHRRLMLGAFVANALFLVSYLTRVATSGTHRFPGGGVLRAAYLALLGSHMVLAVVLVPLVLRTLRLAWTARFQAHRGLARWTWPVWMYVSLTGVAVYGMLYHLAPRLAGP